MMNNECDNNDALVPVNKEKRTWGWFDIFNIWANDIQSLFGYTLVASLFIGYGVTGWTAFAGLITSGLLVMFLVNISGRAGVDYGIPYPVLARASMGTEGAKLPAILRAVVAVFWFGVQTYFASTALYLLLVTLTGVTGGESYFGMTLLGWFSFLIVWALQMVIFSRSMAWVSKFLNIVGPFVYVVMIALLIVLWQKADGQLLSSANSIFQHADASFNSEITGFIAIVGTMVAYFSAVMINFSDFSRYVRDRKSVTFGNLIGLPLNMIIFSALALLITAGATVVYGELLTNPTAIVEKADNTLLSIIAAVTFFAATVGINLVANFIPAVNGISNLAPSKISFKKAGMITSAFALVIGALWTSFISQVGIGGFVNTLGATLAPLYGIMIADYYFFRKQKLQVKELYDSSAASRYYFTNGWNKTALIAFFVSAIFSIATVWVEALAALSGYAWILGAILGALLYVVLSKNRLSESKLANAL